MCAPGGIRTPNLADRSGLLFPLSYERKKMKPVGRLPLPGGILVGIPRETLRGL